MSPSDHDLLRDYARDGSQAAFATLVERHLNLVYSAARRQVRSPQLAEEIAQSVFVDLARHASRFQPDMPLVAWLHVVSRRTAIDVIRRESRRQAREHQAAEIAAAVESIEPAMNPNPSDWSAVEPLLDEAVESLNATDRTAILLRYFENKSLRDIGAALGASEDAAQKRVSRAVEQLRTFFLHRGIAVTAAGLTTDLSAHALQAAPAGLGATISTTAAALPNLAGAPATLEATKTIAMTTLQKSLVAATLALVVGTGLYETRTYALQRSGLDAIGQQSAALTAQLRQLHDDQTAAARRLKSVEAQIDARLAQPANALSAADAALEAQMKTWLANLDRLKRLFEERPALAIPELKLLSDDLWFYAATDAKLDSDDGIRRALANLRHTAENALANKLSQALGNYVKAHDGALPDTLAQLLPLFNPPLDPAMLDRYELLQTGKVSDVPSAQRMNIVAEKSPVDVEFDGYWRIGINGFSNQNAMSFDLGQAQRAFAQNNGGQHADNAADLLPYLKWPVDEAALQRFMHPAPSPASH